MVNHEGALRMNTIVIISAPSDHRSKIKVRENYRPSPVAAIRMHANSWMKVTRASVVPTKQVYYQTPNIELLSHVQITTSPSPP